MQAEHLAVVSNHHFCPEKPLAGFRSASQLLPTDLIRTLQGP